MPRVRPMREDDVPGAVGLFERVYPRYRWRSRAACEAYFREVLFANPWRDLELPSWVVEEDGRLAGVYAVVPRRMRLGARALRIAVGCQFMVEAGPRRSLFALQLTQACLAGPQDLTLADGANDFTRRMWRGIGGDVPLLYALHWTRLLRPARRALALLEERAAVPALLARAARPAAALADALAARLPANRFLRAAPREPEAPFEAADMLAVLPEVMQGAALQPEYEAPALGWLLEQARRKRRHGALRARLVREDGRVLGWFLYYLRRGGAAEVLQLAARPGGFDRMLRALLADAWREGAAAVHGRIDPRYAQELSQRHCWFRWDGTWTLAHTRDPGIAAALHAGDAFLSRLEGEWWLRFLDEDAAAPGTAATPPARRRAPGAARATAEAP
jgi:hypothetical protein